MARKRLKRTSLNRGIPTKIKPNVTEVPGGPGGNPWDGFGDGYPSAPAQCAHPTEDHFWPCLGQSNIYNFIPLLVPLPL